MKQPRHATPQTRTVFSSVRPLSNATRLAVYQALKSRRALNKTA